MPNDPASGPMLEFDKVSLRYGDSWALRDISLTLNPGETRIIFGAAGSGKTTLLKAVIGLVEVDEGRIRLFGQEVTSLRESQLFGLRSSAGVLFQEGGLFDSLSVGENVQYPLLNRQRGDTEVSPEEAEKRVREALRFVELEQTFDKFPAEISGGMRRRVGIARAIVTEPPLVLYDSPTAGLDPITANLIMALVAKERDVRNSASLIVTHRYQDGEIMSDFRYDPEQEELLRVEGAAHSRKRDRTKFIVMKEGQIVFFGTRQDLEKSTDEYVKRFVRHEENHAQ
jgi:phospholipid/cholesterol/gamma-HCH transport system ATP-binding protein